MIPLVETLIELFSILFLLHEFRNSCQEVLFFGEKSIISRCFCYSDYCDFAGNTMALFFCRFCMKSLLCLALMLAIC